jgi:hypothetical protein
MKPMNALSVPIAVAATRRLIEASGPNKPRTRTRGR